MKVKYVSAQLKLAGCLVLIVAIVTATLAAYATIPTAYTPVQATQTAPIAFLTPSQFQAQVSTLTSVMKSRGINAAFSYTEQQIATNPSFAKDCHPLLHELGHAAYTYYGGYAQAIQYQNELCDAGYTHGVLESYLGSGIDITKALQTACDTSSSIFDQWQCYHGLGHGVMLVTLESMPRSIALCKTLPTAFSQGACVNGVYMQHFVVTNHDGSIPKTNPTSLSDCALQPAAYMTTCYNYAPSAYLTVHSDQYSGAIKWCQGAAAGFVGSCISGVGGQAMKDNITNPGSVEAICNLAGPYTISCISGAVGMDVYFHGSGVPAEALCQNQFKAYQSVCNQAVTNERSILQV